MFPAHLAFPTGQHTVELPVENPAFVRYALEWPPSPSRDTVSGEVGYAVAFAAHVAGGKYASPAIQLSPAAVTCRNGHLPTPLAWADTSSGPWTCIACAREQPAIPTVAEWVSAAQEAEPSTVMTPSITECIPVIVAVDSAPYDVTRLGDDDPSLRASAEHLLRIQEAEHQGHPAKRVILGFWHRHQHAWHPTPGLAFWWSSARIAGVFWNDRNWWFDDITLSADIPPAIETFAR